MEQQNGPRETIETYYKPGNIFERDEAYYTQILSGSRRVSNGLQGSRRQSSLIKSRSNIGQQSLLSPSNRQIIQSKTIIADPQQNLYYANSNTNLIPQQSTQGYLHAQEENRQLKRQIDQLLNGSGDFGNSSNVVTLHHYSQSQQYLTTIKEQQDKIRKMEYLLAKNEETIKLYQKGTQELQNRITNIQSIDRELYKTLQSSVNRDRELLQRATQGLARGERREEIAKILQQIISP